jgi:hypothetical protein
MRLKSLIPPGRFFEYSRKDRLLLIEALCLLAFARLAILSVPFRRIAPLLGQTMAESPSKDPESDVRAERISWAVQTAARHTPWESKCLAQALAGKLMLKLRGIASTLYFGVAKEGEASLSAHAWLRCGERVLTGGPVSDRFTMIASFAEVRR